MARKKASETVAVGDGMHRHEIAVDPLKLLTKDLKKAGATLKDGEARYFVNMYYKLQNDRIRACNQERAAADGVDLDAHPDDLPAEVLDAYELEAPVITDDVRVAQPHSLTTFLADNFLILENNIKSVLDVYTKAHVVGLWAQSQIGIGPVITAGLMAHIDPKRCKTAGAVWRFAGLDPSVKWNKKEKRPWNAQLKTLCWKIGESFVKTSGRDNSFYGKIYLKAKEFYTAKNERGDYAEDAARILTEKNWSKTTEAYKALSSGKLPLAQIHARAKRAAVKLFLSHFAAVYWESTTGEVAPKPWAIALGGHADYVPPPNWPMKSKDEEAA